MAQPLGGDVGKCGSHHRTARSSIGFDPWPRIISGGPTLRSSGAAGFSIAATPTQAWICRPWRLSRRKRGETVDVTGTFDYTGDEALQLRHACRACRGRSAHRPGQADRFHRHRGHRPRAQPADRSRPGARRHRAGAWAERSWSIFATTRTASCSPRRWRTTCCRPRPTFPPSAENSWSSRWRPETRSA